MRPEGQVLVKVLFTGVRSPQWRGFVPAALHSDRPRLTRRARSVCTPAPTPMRASRATNSLRLHRFSSGAIATVGMLLALLSACDKRRSKLAIDLTIDSP